MYTSNPSLINMWDKQAHVVWGIRSFLTTESANVLFNSSLFEVGFSILSAP